MDGSGKMKKVKSFQGAQPAMPDPQRKVGQGVSTTAPGNSPSHAREALWSARWRKKRGRFASSYLIKVK